MKKLVVLTLSLVSLQSFACSLTLLKKTATSKSAYIGTQSISSKVQAALATQCDLKVRMMNTNELIEFEKAAFARKIQKLQAKK